MPNKSPWVQGGSPNLVAVADPIGTLDTLGDSRLADPGWGLGGNSTPDQGIAHKIDGMLNAALSRNIAILGSKLSWNNQGNGADGDGGWAEVITQFPRDELIAYRSASTTTGTLTAGVSTSVPVVDRSYFVAGEWVILGTGANVERIQVSLSYVPNVAGAGSVAFATAVANNHASGEPIYHAASGEGWLAKSSCVLVGWGGNDLALAGPRNTIKLDGLVNGTNVGAGRGWDPFKEALRAVISHMRCAVVYRDTHPTCIYTGTWTNSPATTTSSYPSIGAYGGTNLQGATGNNNNFHYVPSGTGAGTASVSITLPPDLPPGATAVMFFLGYVAGGGSPWSFTVNGGPTLRDGSSGTNAYSTTNMNAVVLNEAAGQPSNHMTIGCFRFKNSQPGDIIVATAGAITGVGSIFLAWGVEAPKPPYIGVTLNARPASVAGWASTLFGYGQRAMAGARTATVAAGAGTAAGSVTLGSAITTATAGTVNGLATQPGDTITIGTNPATMETRRIVAIASTTTVSVDANFNNAHTGEAVAIGMQDADFVGGGYVNLSDTQGKTSVPGERGAKLAICSEFDAMVEPLDLDAMINGGPGVASAPYSNFAPDGVHFNDQGSGLGAAGVVQRINRSRMNIPELAMTVVSNRRPFLPVYGDSGVTPAPGSGAILKFQNGWSNYFPIASSAQLFPKTGIYKDQRTREVSVKGCIYGGTDSTIWVQPLGYNPEVGSGRAVIPGWGSAGPGALQIDAGGNVSFLAGYPGTTGWFLFNGSYLSASP